MGVLGLRAAQTTVRRNHPAGGRTQWAFLLSEEDLLQVGSLLCCHSAAAPPPLRGVGRSLNLSLRQRRFLVRDYSRSLRRCFHSCLTMACLRLGRPWGGQMENGETGT